MSQVTAGPKLRQSKLSEFFETRHRRSHPPKISFLSLPPDIRHRVYLESCVGPDKFIDLNHWNKGADLNHLTAGDSFPDAPVLAPKSRVEGGACIVYEEEPDFDDGRQEESFPAGLLRSCRIIHSEVEAILYSQNCFAVTLNAPGGLWPLENLSGDALNSLTLLVVRLRVCACVTPYCIDERHLERPGPGVFWEGDGAHRCMRRPRLGLASRSHKSALAQWRRICSKLAANVRPDNLRLYVTSEVQDVGVARAIAEPLNALPRLKEAAITFGWDPRADLQSLARDTVFRLIKKPAPPQAFRFLSLPFELQLRILEYTDLALRSRTVEWRWEEQCRYSTGNECTYLDNADAKCENFVRREQFCPLHFSAFHVCCQHYDNCRVYFLVSKAFAHAARIVFFSRNRFIIHGRGASVETWDSAKYPLLVRSFLKHRPMDYIRRLSSLALDISPTESVIVGPDQTIWRAWLEAVELLKQVPGLTLEVRLWSVDALDPRSWDRATDLWHGYLRLLKPLAQLRKGLKGFFVYIPCSEYNPEYDSPTACHALPEKEAELERAVMGDEYDSALRGKSRLGWVWRIRGCTKEYYL